MAVASFRANDPLAPAETPGQPRFNAGWRRITFILVMNGFLSLAFSGEIHPIVIVIFLFAWFVGLFGYKPAWWSPAIGKLLVWMALIPIGIIALQWNFSSLLYLLIFLGLFKCLNLREPMDHLHALLMSFFMLLATSIITTSISYLGFILLFIVLIALELMCFNMAREGERLNAADASAGGRAVLPAGLARQLSFSQLFINSILIGMIVLLLAFGLFLIMPHYSTNNDFHSPLARTRPEPERISGYGDEVNFTVFDKLALNTTEVMRVRVAWEPSSVPNAPVARNLLEYFGLHPRNPLRDVVDWANRTRQPMPLLPRLMLASLGYNFGALFEERKVQPDMPNMFGPPPALRLRGTSLDVYDEKRWYQRQQMRNFMSREWRAVDCPPQSALGGPLLVQQIEQSTNLTQRLFGVSTPVRFIFNHGRQLEIQFNWRANSLMVSPWRGTWAGSDNLGRFNYTVISHYSEDAMDVLRQMRAGQMAQPAASQFPTVIDAADPFGNRFSIASEPARKHPVRRDPAFMMDASNREIYTALPTTQLSRQLIAISNQQASAPDAIGKIEQLIDWLQSDFEYSLTPATPRGMHPIQAFLTRTRQGHCEYFATAFVLLLRAQNIPARLVTGFYTTEYSLEANKYVVRQSDAHAWAEVWLDGLGWLTFDPTPPASRGRVNRMAQQPPIFQRVTGAVHAFWQKYILDYSNLQQEQLVTRFLTSRQMQKFANFLENIPRLTGITAPLQALQDESDSVTRTRALWKYIQYFGILIGLIALLVLYRLAIRQRARARPQLSTVSYMNQLLTRLQALGWPRRAGQTPAELIRQVDAQTNGRWELSFVLEYYHRQRFGDATADPEMEARILQTIRNLR